MHFDLKDKTYKFREEIPLQSPKLLDIVRYYPYNKTNQVRDVSPRLMGEECQIIIFVV